MSLTEMAWELLQPAINLGLDESDFWDMTIAELGRWIDGATWRMKNKARFDYQLADLIGISMSRLISEGADFPNIEEVYPNLFEAEKDKEEQPIVKDDIMTISQNRFLAFAQAHNARMQKGVE